MKYGMQVALATREQMVTDEVEEASEADAESTLGLLTYSCQNLFLIGVLPIGSF